MDWSRQAPRRATLRVAARPLTLLAFGWLLVAVSASAQRAPLWDVGIERRDVWLRASAVGGKTVFVSGRELIGDENLTERAIVAALDVRTGRPLWVREGDPAGAVLATASFTSLALSKGVVVAGGAREVDGGTIEGVVRAFDRETGDGLWTKRFVGSSIQIHVAANGRAAFVAAALSGTAIILNAYDLATGARLWEQTYAPEFGSPAVLGFAAGDRFVAVAGSQTGDAGTADVTDQLVRVHDARSGALVWDDVFDAAGGADSALAAVIEGRRLFVGGTQTPENGSPDDLVSAYDLADGSVLWRESSPKEGHQSVEALVVSGGSAIALSLSELDHFVRSYRGKTGRVQWEKDLEVSAGLPTSVLTAKGRRVVVPTAGGVFALDTRTGTLVWSTTREAFTAAISAKQVFGAGFGGVVSYLAR